jgi:hypothetical protein
MISPSMLPVCLAVRFVYLTGDAAKYSRCELEYLNVLRSVSRRIP